MGTIEWKSIPVQCCECFPVCRRPDWQLSRIGEEKEKKKYTMAEGTVQVYHSRFNHLFFNTFSKRFNPFTPNSNSLSCLPYNFCDTSLENLVLDQLLIPWWHFSLFSSLVCLSMYRHCKEKFFLGHLCEWKG